MVGIMRRIFKGLAHYNAAADPEGYATKVLKYYDQIRGSMQKEEATYGDKPAQAPKDVIR